MPTKRPSAPKAAPVTFSSAFLDTTTTPAPPTTPLPMDIMREEINDQLEHNTPNTFLGRVFLVLFNPIICYILNRPSNCERLRDM